jgi:tetratricopeptide (TPR) repeat protein
VFESQRDRRMALKFSIVLFAVCAAYGNSLFNGFVYDDLMQVLQNPWVTNIRFLPQIFSHDVWGYHGGRNNSSFYRPLMNVILMLDHYVFDWRPWGYHLVNILFHAANSLLVFLLASRLFPVTNSLISVPLLSSLFFAVHPIHTEAVAWVCGITDNSYAFFFLLAVLLYASAAGSTRNWRYILSLISFMLALLCKEPAVLLPGILLALDYALPGPREALSRRVNRYAPYLIILVLYLAIRSYALGELVPVKSQSGYDGAAYPMNVVLLFTQYVGKMLWPVNLSALHPFHPVSSLWEPRELLGIAVALAFVAAGAATFKKNRTMFFGLTLFVLPLLPALHLPVLGRSPLGERYLYLPSAGFLLVLAMLTVWLHDHAGRYRVIVLSLVLITTTWYTAQTVRRNTVWKDNITLLGDNVKNAPADESMLEAYVGALVPEARYDEIIEAYQRFVAVNPTSERAFFNLGVALHMKRRLSEAEAAYKKSLALEGSGPSAHVTYFRLGVAELEEGRLDDAIAHLQTSAQQAPLEAAYHSTLGAAYLRKKRYDDAIREFETTLQLTPGDAASRLNLERARELRAGSP